MQCEKWLTCAEIIAKQIYWPSTYFPQNLSKISEFSFLFSFLFSFKGGTNVHLNEYSVFQFVVWRYFTSSKRRSFYTTDSKIYFALSKIHSGVRVCSQMFRHRFERTRDFRPLNFMVRSFFHVIKIIKLVKIEVQGSSKSNWLKGNWWNIFVIENIDTFTSNFFKRYKSGFKSSSYVDSVNSRWSHLVDCRRNSKWLFFHERSSRCPN